jgi:hypothetical protein
MGLARDEDWEGLSSQGFDKRRHALIFFLHVEMGSARDEDWEGLISQGFDRRRHALILSLHIGFSCKGV